MYKETARTELQADDGATLSVIVESNGVSWKVFARHIPAGGNAMNAADSTWDSYPTEEGAIKGFQEKVQEAIDLGWQLSVPPIEPPNNRQEGPER